MPRWMCLHGSASICTGRGCHGGHGGLCVATGRPVPAQPFSPPVSKTSTRCPQTAKPFSQGAQGFCGGRKKSVTLQSQIRRLLSAALSASLGGCWCLDRLEGSGRTGAPVGMGWSLESVHKVCLGGVRAAGRFSGSWVRSLSSCLPGVVRREELSA